VKEASCRVNEHKVCERKTARPCLIGLGEVGQRMTGAGGAARGTRGVQTWGIEGRGLGRDLRLAEATRIPTDKGPGEFREGSRAAVDSGGEE